jgi:rhodanese-related sulfurtransferase
MKRVIFIVLAAIIFTACTSAPRRTTDSVISVKHGVSEMTPLEARPGIDAAYSQFIDVRTPEEFNSGHAARTRNIPLDTLMQSIDKLEKNEPVFLISQSGKRSMIAAELLNKAGFSQTISVAGGTTAWQEEGLPMAK